MTDNEILFDNILKQIKSGTKIVLISGASSSGKTYIADKLKDFLAKNDINSVSISTDAFYKNNSQIILDAYFEHNFKFFDEKTYKKVLKIIDYHTLNKTFTKQFDDKNCKRILIDLSTLVGTKIASKTVEILKNGIKNIDFDTPNAVNLAKCAEYCNLFYSGKLSSIIIPKRNFTYSRIDYLDENSVSVSPNTVLIVEGIYALNSSLVNKLKNANYKLFIDCDFNTLLVRRFNRDIIEGRSSMSKDVVIENFLSSTMTGYIKHTYPDRQKADYVFDNSYTQGERDKNNQTKQIKFIVKNPDCSMFEKLNTQMHKDFYLSPTVKNRTNEVVRIREENGKVKDITHKSESNQTKTWLKRPEQKFDLSDITNPNLRNSISVCSMFFKAGYTFAGCVKKHRTNYKYKDVKFCVDTFTDGSQSLEIQSGSKQNIEYIADTLNLNIVEPRSYYVTHLLNNGTEKEIKVKLSQVPENCVNCERTEQTYLNTELAKEELSKSLSYSLEPYSEIRIRKQGEKYYLTLKSSGTNNRKEKEYVISSEFAINLLKYKQSKTIIKDRYLVAENDEFKLEVDNYLNLEMPLTVAEVEYINTEKEAINFLEKNISNKYIEKDITSDINYKNSHLAAIVKDTEKQDDNQKSN